MDSSSIMVILACGRFKGKSEATKSELSKDFFFISFSSLLIRFSLSSYPDKVRGEISNSSLFMLHCSFVVSRGSERGWSIR